MFPPGLKRIGEGGGGGGFKLLKFVGICLKRLHSREIP